jgi:uncharacterized protein (TIGR03067 family)
MNKLILILVVTFGAVFGGSYVLMQRGNDKAPPTPATDKPDEVAQVKTEDSSPARKTGTVESQPKPEPESPPVISKDENPNTREQDIKKEAKKPTGSKNRGERTGSKPNKSSQTIVGKPAATPKTREVNGGIWDNDLDALHGTWKMVDAVYDGERKASEAKDYSWDFRVDEYKIMYKGNAQERWAVEVNSSRHPKTIDSTGLETSVGPVYGKKLKGIYEVTDDSLHVCYDLTGYGRPDSFEAAKGSRRVSYYFKR